MLDDINTVFLPTDFSENAREALPFAAEIALRAKARLTLLHCVEENIHFTPQKEQRKEKIIKETTEAFDKLVGELEEDDSFRELQIGTKLVSGHPVENILEEVRS
ncbi:MAG: universal stress protein [Balneolaceae bacterium]|nr:universal stress protein [Balneolaceae bacterium]